MIRKPSEAEQAAASEWDANAERWAASLRAQQDVINESFGLPRFLAFLGDLGGREVLDTGCGEGRSSRHLADRGAKVTGIDISPGMIAQARRREEARPQGIVYRVAACADLSPFPAEQFDLVTSVMALMDTADLAGALREFARVLRPGGSVAIMLRHPCFFTHGYTQLLGADGRPSGVAVAGYFRRQPYLERWRFPGQEKTAAAPFAVTRHPRTLADYVNALLTNGFTITGIAEPRPSEEACRRHPNLRFWQRHAALYLFLCGRKNGAPPTAPGI